VRSDAFDTSDWRSSLSLGATAGLAQAVGGRRGRRAARGWGVGEGSGHPPQDRRSPASGGQTAGDAREPSAPRRCPHLAGARARDGGCARPERQPPWGVPP